MRETSFGRMVDLVLPGPLSPHCEVMHFDKVGSFHSHPDKDEVAILISGEGQVAIQGGGYPMKPGDFIHIYKGQSHRMEPAEGSTMEFFIAYLETSEE